MAPDSTAPASASPEGTPPGGASAGSTPPASASPDVTPADIASPGIASPSSRPSAGPPAGPPAAELIAAGFELENADAPLLHHGINLADIAHVIDLGRAGVIPPAAARQLLALLLETLQVPADEFPYEPAYGEPYNSRERYFVARVGDVAGWLHAGRPRREAMRIAFRLHLRGALTDLIEAAARLAAELGVVAGAHAGTLMADQTYLQHAQPSTFGHYLLSFAFPVLREGHRLEEALTWTDASPGGAGCVNGTRLRSDRATVARLLGFRGIAEHTRDAMWQTDGLFDMVGAATGLAVTQAKLAEDLEIWASQEFDYVTLADAYSRASVLMPQKRNPYALSIIRGSAGTLIGRLTGLLAVAKTPSARSDNLIFAYGEVPKALDLALRATRLSTGVVRTMEVNAARMKAVLDAGFSQSTDLAEYIMQACGIDYRTAYRIVGQAVRDASTAGLRGADIDAALLARAAEAVTGRPLDLTAHDLGAVLDPAQIVQSRTGVGGAAPGEVTRMAAGVAQQAAELAAGARRWRSRYQRAEDDLIAAARGYAEETGSPDFGAAPSAGRAGAGGVGAGATRERTAGAGTAGAGTAGAGTAGAGTAGAGTAGAGTAGAGTAGAGTAGEGTAGEGTAGRAAAGETASQSGGQR
jgi:argininosuccinate lyase